MSDNAWTDTYGPSTPGAINVVSGQTNGMLADQVTKSPSTVASPSYYVNDGQGGTTMVNDVDPATDVCSNNDKVFLAGKNIGDLLNDAGITWGGFMGGFDLNTKNPNGTTGCKRSTYSPIVGERRRRLHPASQLVRVLSVDREFAPTPRRRRSARSDTRSNATAARTRPTTSTISTISMRR